MVKSAHLNDSPKLPDRRLILRRAWPVVLANASVPLLGLSDTAVIGNVGDLEELGAIAFGAIIFSFVYWSFGFLRMGTTGFVAQAAGAGDEMEIRAALWRAVFLGVGIGLVLWLLQGAITAASLQLLNGSTSVEALTASYVSTRIWGAPAALALFALMGCLIGLGHSKSLLVVQLSMNVLNIVLDIYFAAVLDMGVRGVALGTAIAEWSALLLALIIVMRSIRQRQPAAPLVPWARVRQLAAMRHTLSVNGDIMIRTMVMVLSFAWFVRQSAVFGDDVLAGNHILLQLISFSAFFLDAYAHVAEALAGEALGARDLKRFDHVFWRSTELAGVTAVLLALGILLGGPWIISQLTQHVAVQQAALNALPWAALYVALAFVAFQLDGIFIGATQTVAMRNAALLSSAGFVPLSLILPIWLGLAGLWLAFVIYVCLRAVTLMLCLPALRQRLQAAETTPAADAI